MFFLILKTANHGSEQIWLGCLLFLNEANLNQSLVYRDDNDSMCQLLVSNSVTIKINQPSAHNNWIIILICYLIPIRKTIVLGLLTPLPGESTVIWAICLMYIPCIILHRESRVYIIIKWPKSWPWENQCSTGRDRHQATRQTVY